ncbi:carboxymuconolactone decarboxylase family protein [Mycolicibacterium holsaticum]|uniref:carboxymuconolactone decarboxylase family protein n=1 Tax=Mycolicibacterium holsaticum TaxID=152142 RepID=UPI001C7D17AF|nr:carboxymuconolactone decarboxylase family protein [Mycolicibacterium holsaticum]MDA4107494.1 carboxymuconolactone decarboxylase [Mycolicibacterium holsaticum DSM 44478 = JCM 12374]QZA11163.1 carboxymuconolactone decarboxylase family protein [Mycolicibacterium holsaticum DSM 44478 = JCM 12374]UNC11343.1 carboxymuconolactone decarboxylase family protein [Mycolicibacterium holsaticum DSM 44478 = JCM 12374]
MTEDTDAPLLSPLTADQWGDDEYDALGALMGIPGDQVPRAGSGHPRDPLNFDIIGVLAQHPKMARVFLSYNAFLLQRGELPVRLRELAVLRLAHARRSAFFWGEHVRVATAGGLPEEDIARVARGNDGFDGLDRLVLEATDQMLADGQVDAPTWHRLVDEIGTHQAMELIFVVGTYAMLATACATWRLAPPPGSAELP